MGFYKKELRTRQRFGGKYYINIPTIYNFELVNFIYNKAEPKIFDPIPNQIIKKSTTVNLLQINTR